MSYQRHNFDKTRVNAFKSYLVQVETCTDMSLLRPSRMDPFNSYNKIIPGTSKSKHAYVRGRRQYAAIMQRQAVTVMPSCSGGSNVVVA
jgi:hypothetical protein